MNADTKEYIKACRASQVNQDWWAKHPLQRAMQALRAKERAEVKRAYRDLRKQMEARA